MRILQVSSSEGMGGGETHVLDLVRGLRGRGHDVVLAGRRGSAIAPEIHLPFLNSADIYTAFRLRRLLKRQPFDIVHVHVARDYLPVAAALRNLGQTKLIATRHLLFPVKPHSLYRRMDGWIAPTSQILKSLEPLRPKAAVVIPNWVDLDRFQRSDRPTHEPPLRLGLLGQIAPHKGHDDAVEALRLLGSGYQLAIAGAGDAPYLRDLRRRAQKLPVRFEGFVAAPEFLGRIDILLVPSWEEPFGLVILEAMAAGVPVVATAAGGPLEIIRPGEDGALVAPRDPFALARAVRELAADSAYRVGLVRRARARVEEVFGMGKAIERVERFYLE